MATSLVIASLRRTDRRQTPIVRLENRLSLLFFPLGVIGSTTDSGSVSLGSSPEEEANLSMV